MDYALTEDQRMFRTMFIQFCTNEIRPRGEQIDRSEEPPEDLLSRAVDQGFWAALVPEALDGAGLDIYTYMLMLEELARADMSTAMILSVHNSLVVKPLLDHGSQDQQARYLEALAFGERLGAFALTEPGAGSDAAAIQTTAARDNGDYRLEGTKVWVCNAAQAGLILLVAQAEGGATAFLVEPGTPGLTVGYREKTFGLRGVCCNTLYLDGARVPAANRLGPEGKGLAIALQALDLSRLGMGALALGASQRALEEAVKFSLEHIQFGVPIAQKQAIQNYIADAKVQIEALRCMVGHAAWLADTCQPFSPQASWVKLFGSRTARQVTDRMLQVHGGYGYMKEYAIERYYRDCRALEIVEGSSQIQQYLIARDIYAAEGLEIRP
jgi:alkylation response protein AidB-like acyl-CoA dehydrogenase